MAPPHIHGPAAAAVEMGPAPIPAPDRQRRPGVAAPSTSPPAPLQNLLRALPKAHLHVHLEGTIAGPTLRLLARRHPEHDRLGFGGMSETDLSRQLTFRSFPAFVEVFMAIQELIRSAADLELVVLAAAQRQAEENVRYIEFTVTPYTHVVHQGKFALDELLAGLERGRQRALTELDLHIRYIFDCHRNLSFPSSPAADGSPAGGCCCCGGGASTKASLDAEPTFDPEPAEQTLAMALAGRAVGVVGLGLGGFEGLAPPAHFAAVFRKAKAAGLLCVPHAGETLGADSVRVALESLQADRIAHGCRAAEDDELVAELGRRRVPLDMALTSNLLLHVYDDLGQHPFRRLDEAGALVTLNTDDPALFNTDLTREYSVLHETLGYELPDLLRVARNGFEAIADAPLRAALLADFDAFAAQAPAALAAEAGVLAFVLQRFPPAQAPMMHAHLRDMRQRQPFRHLRILHNVPVTLSTLFKILCLQAGGALLTVTEPVFVQSNAEALALLAKTTIRHQPTHAECAARGGCQAYDLLLDTCCELGQAGFQPRLGAVELTQTGEVLYRALAPAYPALSIDSTQVKRVEDALGSSDGFMRALAHLGVGPRLGAAPGVEPRVVLFGFGKVGLGLAQRILARKPELEAEEGSLELAVVEVDEAAMQRARAVGVAEVVDGRDRARVTELVRAADCIVTATGLPEVVVRSIGEAAAEEILGGQATAAAGTGRAKVLANIGTHDEFGASIPAARKLFGGRPVNFCLEEPTTIEYLDPAFLAHHVGAERLVEEAARTGAGVCSLSPADDAAILEQWSAFHPDKVELLKGVLAHWDPQPAVASAGAAAAPS